jgi:hypothetical protein
MGNPLFKAQDDGQFEILWEREGLTQNELQQGARRTLLLDLNDNQCRICANYLIF